jgi:hypothetical protein
MHSTFPPFCYFEILPVWESSLEFLRAERPSLALSVFRGVIGRMHVLR